MIEEKLEIPTLGAEVNLYRPDRLADYPGIVFITDVWGVRPANIGMARRLAEKGFAVLVPNAFHRYSRNRAEGFMPKDEGEKTKVLYELFAALTPQQMDSDSKAYVDFLTAQTHVKAGKVGVVGHCYTGQMAVRMAALMADRIAAAASLTSAMGSAGVGVASGVLAQPASSPSTARAHTSDSARFTEGPSL